MIQTDIINVRQMRFASSRFISRRDNNGINTRERDNAEHHAQSVLLLTARAAVSQEIKGSAVNLEHRIYNREHRLSIRVSSKYFNSRIRLLLS